VLISPVTLQLVVTYPGTVLIANE